MLSHIGQTEGRLTRPGWGTNIYFVVRYVVDVLNFLLVFVFEDETTKFTRGIIFEIIFL